MQLMPGTAAEMGVTQIFDPAQNIAGGTQYLMKMLALFNGDKKLALAAYNAGPENVKKTQRRPPLQRNPALRQKSTRIRKKHYPIRPSQHLGKTFQPPHTPHHRPSLHPQPKKNISCTFTAASPNPPIKSLTKTPTTTSTTNTAPIPYEKTSSKKSKNAPEVVQGPQPSGQRHRQYLWSLPFLTTAKISFFMITFQISGIKAVQHLYISLPASAVGSGRGCQRAASPI